MSNKFSGDIIDRTDKRRRLIAGIIGISVAALYHFGIISGPHKGVSDMIAVSSIMLATTGVFIGLLVGEVKNSEFFRKVTKVRKSDEFFCFLLMKTRNIFIENIIFILLTLSFDFIKPFSWKIGSVNLMIYIKSLVVLIWIYLLLLSLWDLFYVVDCITNIMANKKKEDVGTTD